MRAAQLDNDSKVINVIEVNSLDILPNLIDGTGANIGDTWDGQQFIPAPPTPEPVPDSVTMRQCCLQLEIDGVLDDVEAAVSTMPKLAQIEWQRATNVQRSNPLVPAMQYILGWDDTRVDQFYTEGSQL